MGSARRAVLAAATAAVPRVFAQSPVKLASSMKKAPFAFTRRRPAPASRRYCFRAEG